MALREFEPIPAKYYPKNPNELTHQLKFIPFWCNALSPDSAIKINPVKGIITGATKAVIYTSDRYIDFKVGGLVEYNDKKLKIAEITVDTTDTNMLGAAKLKNITRLVPKWMALE